jgi:hypothetical protein
LAIGQALCGRGIVSRQMRGGKPRIEPSRVEEKRHAANLWRF